LLNSGPMASLRNAAADYSGLANDIFSYQKEVEFEGEMHNGVLVVQHFLGCDQRQAVAIVNDLMTQRMRQFERIVAEDLPVLARDLDLDPETRESLDSYVAELRDWMAGVVEWHCRTGRYRETELRAAAQPEARLAARAAAVKVPGPAASPGLPSAGGSGPGDLGGLGFAATVIRPPDLSGQPATPELPAMVLRPSS
jgi:germacradienol/geosmin synthase